MANPFVAEIRIFPFNFAPKGWAFCNGQLLPLSQNTALFSLLGTTYGGDGKSNFALPNLQGNAAMQPGQGPGLSLHDLGETGGSDTVTLLTDRDAVSHSYHQLHRWRQSRGAIRPAGQRSPCKDRRLSGECLHQRRHAESNHGHEYGGDSGRQSAAQQPDAVSHAQLLHRAAGCFPAA